MKNFLLIILLLPVISICQDIQGCMDESACNYNMNATVESEYCEYAYGCDYCSGATNGTGYIIENDININGVCDNAYTSMMMVLLRKNIW